MDAGRFSVVAGTESCLRLLRPIIRIITPMPTGQARRASGARVDKPQSR